MAALHFWTLRPNDGLERWDPDADPTQHLSGYGHAFLELYVRMKAGGYSVSVGPDIPRHADSVVVSLEELSGWGRNRHGSPAVVLRLYRRLLFRRVGLAVIRTDVPLRVQSPKCATVEVMPTHASVRDAARQIVLPLLAQRGLIPRSGDRGKAISRVGLKAYSFNVPDWVPRLEDLLRVHDVELRVDTERGDTAGWHDFGELDAVLCLQSAESSEDAQRKPPTKLVNAWAAGVVPVCSPHPGYLELAVPGRDALIATTPEEIATAISRISHDSDLAGSLLRESVERGRSYTLDALLPRWFVALASSPPTTMHHVLMDVVTTVVEIPVLVGSRIMGSLRGRGVRPA